MDEPVDAGVHNDVRLGMNQGRSVQDAPEPEVCGKGSPKALVQLLCEGIKLSLRSPQGRRDGSGRTIRPTTNQRAGEESQTPGDVVTGI